MSELPKVGEAVPISRFIISKMNIRADEEFGLSEEDFTLSHHLQKQSLVQPIVARPEDNEFGVVIGRRRFLSKKKAGAKTLIVGEDVLIRKMSDEEALDDSLKENLPIFRQELNPMARARVIKRVLETKGITLRELERRWNIPHTNLAEWMSLLELTPKLQTVVEKKVVSYTDALKIARLNPPKDVQDRLSEVAGSEEFRNELTNLMKWKAHGEIPAGKYRILRLRYGRETDEIELYEKIERLAKVMNKTLEEMTKWIIVEYFKKK